ncbi:MAG: hypothetical protein KGZ83_16525 [Sulfuricella sp.]|nr:hypothetical protein [Sulfuricella sp.]
MNSTLFDPECALAHECYVVIHAPGRQRKRFPENCVTEVASAEAALQAADPDKKRFAAVVLGPARSSEGFRVYHLLRWL